ncbi:hypothetical protein [Prevotella jejuni]
MSKINKKITPKPINDSIGTRIAKAVFEAKKISERIFGYISYDIRFVKATYAGKTQRPAKITSIEKGIVGILLVDETASFEKIGLILGLDVVNDKAEQAILRSAIETLRGFNAIEGDDSCLALTDAGRNYADKGERPDTYSKTFDIYVDKNHSTWYNIKNCIGEYTTKIEEINTPCDDLKLTLDQIKNYAEYQAQDVHFPQNRYLLENALWSEGHEASYKVYVCFVQSVASSDEVRAFVYDENSNNLNQLMAEAINSNQELMAELLENCIKLECESDEETVILEGNDVEVAKSEISEDIKEAEKHLVKEEEESTQIPIETSPDNKAVETDHKSLEKDRLHKKALYDSLSFEIELQKIFNEDDPDEIWLISPWIRKSAFIHDRGPLIENFLKDDSKRVFIAYSEPASNNDGKPMMDEEVEPGIKLLAEQYPNFFYVQLPEFHLKNVIEVKGDQKILFSGSFNVLSFSVSEQQKHVRREEMTLAHHTVAKNKYADFQLEFAQIYAERIKKEIEVLDSSSISNYKNERLEYFSGIDNQEIQKIFSPIEDLLEEKNLSVVKSKIMKKLTTIGQQLVAASNMGGLNAKDKKKIGTELSEVKKIISENSIDDPSSLDQLSTTKELYEKIPLKQIFPNKSRKADNRTPKTINKPLANEGATNPNLDEKVKNLISGDNPSDEKEMLYLLLSLSYASSRRLITKGDLQKNIKHIVMDLADLYTILTVESSMNNDQATDITIGVSHHSVKFRNLYLGNTRIQYERHVKTLNDGKRLTWVTPRNVESILSNLLK